jgi:tetratricopeptide (TPR) repeat protein
MKCGCATLSVIVLLVLAIIHSDAQAEDVTTAFQQANQLYDQGRFREAAEAYQRLIDGGHVAASLYYNLGNAWFKAGQLGRAVAAYRLAAELTPRDPDLQANLQFVRRLASGGSPPRTAFRRRLLATLTLDEWSWLAAGSGWLWFLLLAAGQWRVKLRKGLRRYTRIAGASFTLLLLLTAAAFADRTRTQWAIVVVPEASVHYGPLAESPEFYRLRDGAEVGVLDIDRDWLQVIDQGRRKGWLLRDQVLLLRPVAAITNRVARMRENT